MIRLFFYPLYPSLHTLNHPGIPVRKLSRFNLFPYLFHQPEIKSKIVKRGSLHTKEFVTPHQVVKIAHIVSLTVLRRKLGVQDIMMIFPLRISYLYNTISCKYHSSSCIPGRHDAIEHIDTECNALNQVTGRTDTH